MDAFEVKSPFPSFTLSLTTSPIDLPIIVANSDIADIPPASSAAIPNVV